MTYEAAPYVDRTQETTTTTGTGTVTLAGAVSNYQAFSANYTTGQTVYYCITDNAGNWEVGKGTYTTSGTTLSRDIVFASSNSNALVNFGAGTKFCFAVLPGPLIADMGRVLMTAMCCTTQ
jgi:hypothetical protein